MAKFNKIRKMDIANGPGVRVSIFMQGCPFHCKGCFNKETWDFNEGQDFTNNEIAEIINLAKDDYIKGLSILGGEPLHPNTIEATKELAKAFKEKYPNKTIWLWTGYLFENIPNKEALNYIDVLIDGQFKEELHDPRLKWRGSSNQRVIDIQKTLKANKIILYKSES